MFDFDDDEDCLIPRAESVVKGYEDEPKLSDFEIKKELGIGGFGKVNLCKYKANGMEYAIKQIDKQKVTMQPNQREMFKREVVIMTKLKHKRVVKLYSQFEDEQYCYLVMEYIKGGNLYQYCNSLPNKIMPADKAAKLICELCGVLDYLHNKTEQKIIHRDIKPENCFLDSDGELKLGDFGGSNFVSSGEFRTTTCGTPPYHSPEMLSGEGYNESVDIWAVGVLIFEILCGYPPFKYKDLEVRVKNVDINWPSKIDKDLKDLISKILVKDPKKRLSLLEICHHKYITQYISNPDIYFETDSNQDPSYPFILSRGCYADKEFLESLKPKFGEKEEDIHTENERLKILNKNKDEKINDYIDQINTLNKQHLEKVNMLTHKISKQEKQLEEKEKFIKEEKIYRINSSMEIESLKESNKTLTQKLEELTIEHNLLKEKYDMQISKLQNALKSKSDFDTLAVDIQSSPVHIQKLMQSFRNERDYFNKTITKYDKQINDLYDKLSEYNSFEIKMKREFKNYQEQIQEKDKTILNLNNLIRKLFKAIGQVENFTDMCKNIRNRSLRIFTDIRPQGGKKLESHSIEYKKRLNKAFTNIKLNSSSTNIKENISNITRVATAK